MSTPPPAHAGNVFWQLSLVFALVATNAFFVASEFALVSVRRTRIDHLAAQGNSSAQAVQRAFGNIGTYIAATQVGVTVSSLVLGGMGAQALEPLLLPLCPWTGRWMGFTRLGIATALAYFVMTTMHVVLGELLPKAITLAKTETTALVLVRPMALFSRLVTPLVWMLNGLGNILLSLLGLGGVSSHNQVHSAEELDLLFAQSHQGGEISATEFEILHRVVRFSDLTAREIMVPRVDMQSLPCELDRAQLADFLHSQPHTRVPVYHGTLDEVVGVAHLKDLVPFYAALPSEPNRVNLMQVVREASRVPESVTIDKLLVEFKRRRHQIAIVIDEFGGTAGLVTMGDLLEQVFGDLPDEQDTGSVPIAVGEDGIVRLSGRVLIAELNERFDLAFSCEDADTVAGLVLARLGRPARVGDVVEIGGSRLRVADIDRLKIIRIEFEPGEPALTDEVVSI